VNEFIDHLYTPVGITSNYSAIANLHTLQITIAPAKSFYSLSVFISSSLATASNSGDTSASRAQILSSQPPTQSSTLNWLAPRLAAISHQPPTLLFTGWLSTEHSCTHLGLTTRSLLLVWQLRSWSCGAPSLTRGRVCLLYMLLTLASAIFLCSESLGTRDHILLSQIWDFSFRRLLRLAGPRWRYSIPPPQFPRSLTRLHGQSRKHLFQP
jgi:hypothetical protein